MWIALRGAPGRGADLREGQCNNYSNYIARTSLHMRCSRWHQITHLAFLTSNWHCWLVGTLMYSELPSALGIRECPMHSGAPQQKAEETEYRPRANADVQSLQCADLPQVVNCCIPRRSWEDASFSSHELQLVVNLVQSSQKHVDKVFFKIDFVARFNYVQVALSGRGSWSGPLQVGAVWRSRSRICPQASLTFAPQTWSSLAASRQICGGAGRDVNDAAPPQSPRTKEENGRALRRHKSTVQWAREIWPTMLGSCRFVQHM